MGQLEISATERAKAALNTEPAKREDGREGIAMKYCPRCSTRLAERSCKLICPDCGYYMSCSDFY
jgi:hypothetical protein